MASNYSGTTWFERNPKKSSIAIFIITIIILVLSLELALRYTPYKELISGSRHFPQYMVRADNTMGYDLASNFPPGTHVFADYSYTVFSNAYGCFDKNNEKTDDYVLLLGDSFTWGYAPYEDKWGTLLEELTEVRIYKCGVPGFGVGQSVNKGYQTVAQLGTRPKLIVYGYFFNDLEDDYLFPRDTVIHGHLASLIKEISIDRDKIERYTAKELENRYENYLRYGHPGFDRLGPVQRLLQRMRFWLKTNSILARLVRQAISLASIENLQIPDLYGEDPELSGAWKLHGNYARDLVRLARENDASLLVVLIPKRGDVYTRSPEQIRIAREKHDKVAGLFQGGGVKILDLLIPFREHVQQNEANKINKDLYWKDDMHWNINGNHLAGELVGSYIVQHGLLGQIGN